MIARLLAWWRRPPGPWGQLVMRRRDLPATGADPYVAARTARFNRREYP